METTDRILVTDFDGCATAADFVQGDRVVNVDGRKSIVRDFLNGEVIVRGRDGRKWTVAATTLKHQDTDDRRYTVTALDADLGIGYGQDFVDLGTDELSKSALRRMYRHASGTRQD